VRVEVGEEVGYVSGRTRLYGIVGDPIEQVRSPEMFTAEFVKRGYPAILVPLHVLPARFDATLAGLMSLANLDGLVFTIPYKARAMGLAAQVGAQARVVGAINALARRADGRWRGEIFDGLGCVAGFKARGLGFAGKRVQLIGAGGAGSAVGVAVAAERPALLRLCDVDATRAETLAGKVRGMDPAIEVVVGPPRAEGVDILMNASPVGMLGDARLPLEVGTLPSSLVVFDAIVKPEQTPLLALAQRCGCTTVTGREMMRGQIARMTDFFLEAR
jgi:shikimate dehydrogenase